MATEHDGTDDGVLGQFADGESVAALAYADLVLTFGCAKAFPPGKPLTLELRLPEQNAVALVGRCIGSKQQADGRYVVRMRLTNLRREVRLALEQALAR